MAQPADSHALGQLNVGIAAARHPPPAASARAHGRPFRAPAPLLGRGAGVTLQQGLANTSASSGRAASGTSTKRQGSSWPWSGAWAAACTMAGQLGGRWGPAHPGAWARWSGGTASTPLAGGVGTGHVDHGMFERPGAAGHRRTGSNGQGMTAMRKILSSARSPIGAQAQPYQRPAAAPHPHGEPTAGAGQQQPRQSARRPTGTLAAMRSSVASCSRQNSDQARCGRPPARGRCGRRTHA
jgi:hypothetical protein